MIVEIEEEVMGGFEALPLLSLNHVSLLVKCVYTSVRFYQHVLGFFRIKRPSSFNFHGAWLYNYGIGIHLLENESIDEDDCSIGQPRPINPKDNHISFQCTDVEVVKMRLAEMGLQYVTAVVEEGGIKVDQVFFHDPDGYMIEICNCDNIPVIPISSSCTRPTTFFNTHYAAYRSGGCRSCCFNKTPPLAAASVCKCGFLEAVMMESLSVDMMDFSF